MTQPQLKAERRHRRLFSVLVAVVSVVTAAALYLSIVALLENSATDKGVNGVRGDVGRIRGDVGHVRDRVKRLERRATRRGHQVRTDRSRGDRHGVTRRHRPPAGRDTSRPSTPRPIRHGDPGDGSPPAPAPGIPSTPPAPAPSPLPQLPPLLPLPPLPPLPELPPPPPLP